MAMTKEQQIECIKTMKQVLSPDVYFIMGFDEKLKELQNVH